MLVLRTSEPRTYYVVALLTLAASSVLMAGWLATYWRFLAVLTLGVAGLGSIMVLSGLLRLLRQAIPQRSQAFGALLLSFMLQFTYIQMTLQPSNRSTAQASLLILSNTSTDPVENLVLKYAGHTLKVDPLPPQSNREIKLNVPGETTLEAVLIKDGIERKASLTYAPTGHTYLIRVDPLFNLLPDSN